MTAHRYRMFFGKVDDMRWISHRDLLRLFERALRRAGLPLAMSQGFHPKPKLSFPSALALGLESNAEIVEFSLSAWSSVAEVQTRLAGELPEGLPIHSLEALEANTPKLALLETTYRVDIPAACAAQAAHAVSILCQAPERWVTGKKKDQEIDVKKGLLELRFEDPNLWIRQDLRESTGVGPREILRALGLAELPESGARIVRTTVKTTASILAPPTGLE